MYNIYDILNTCGIYIIYDLLHVYIIYVQYSTSVAYVAIQLREVSLIMLYCCAWRPLRSTIEILLHLADLRVLQMNS